MVGKGSRAKVQPLEHFWQNVSLHNSLAEGGMKSYNKSCSSGNRVSILQQSGEGEGPVIFTFLKVKGSIFNLKYNDLN